jgi:hypothetical protein
MKLSEFQTAYAHNAKIIKHCLDTRTNDFSDIIFWEGVQGKTLGFDELTSKWADVLGCSVIGALPSIERQGADGYIYYRGDKTPYEVETKVSGIRHKDLALGQRGGLYYSANLENWNSKCNITSHFMGAFDANMSALTMQSKKRDTFLIPFDKTENKIIDAYRLSADRVLELLENRKHNASITFKLSAFQQHGARMGTQWDVEGFDKWCSRLSKQTKEAKRFIL